LSEKGQNLTRVIWMAPYTPVNLYKSINGTSFWCDLCSNAKFQSPSLVGIPRSEKSNLFFDGRSCKARHVQNRRNNKFWVLKGKKVWWKTVQMQTFVIEAKHYFFVEKKFWLPLYLYLRYHYSLYNIYPTMYDNIRYNISLQSYLWTMHDHH
jgi:hypothetical protein